MALDRPGALAAIGGTPVVRLTRLAQPGMAEIWVYMDEIITVSTDDAFAMARRAAREDGVWSGPSTGANLVAARIVAARLGPDARVATVQVDPGLKYLAGEVYA